NFVTIEIAYRVKAHGIDHKGAVYNDRFQDGTYHAERDWWPQAEGVVGFFDAYQSSMDEELLETSSEIWNYIQLFQKDYENGEWYWGCDEDGNPIVNKDKAGPWKAPYHNGRMCIEMIKRLSNN
ncbi:MAG TPA: AGE family epimerase/isomerase, partial [Saprospiraceae bacterium]|nr:AGE family epimerase/isomerase [Saprospiraceae bacterium]